MKRGFHILCSKRNDTKLEPAAKHGIVAKDTRPKLAFDPWKTIHSQKEMASTRSTNAFETKGTVFSSLYLNHQKYSHCSVYIASPAYDNFCPCCFCNTLTEYI